MRSAASAAQHLFLLTDTSKGLRCCLSGPEQQDVNTAMLPSRVACFQWAEPSSLWAWEALCIDYDRSNEITNKKKTTMHPLHLITTNFETSYFLNGGEWVNFTKYFRKFSATVLLSVLSPSERPSWFPQVSIVRQTKDRESQPRVGDRLPITLLLLCLPL